MGKERDTEIAADGLLHSLQHTYKRIDCMCDSVCVCMHIRDARKMVVNE